MTSAAQHWYYMLDRDSGDVLWQLFKVLCQQRFGPAIGINHLADLSRLQFRGTISEYQETFLAKMAHAGYLTSEQQVRLFTRGLPDAIRVDVELQAPQDLQRAMALARAYEQRTTALAAAATGGRPSRPPMRFHHHSIPASTTPAPVVQKSITTLGTSTAPSSSLPASSRTFKKLSPTEMMEQRRLGICYNCNKQYVRGHKCPKLFYLEVTDFEEDGPSAPCQDTE
jgi:hypothetical protein